MSSEADAAGAPPPPPAPVVRFADILFVDAVLDPLKALRHRAHATRESLEIGRRGQVERPHRDVLCLRRLLARGLLLGQRAHLR